MGKAEEEAKKIKSAIDSSVEAFDELLFVARDFTQEAKQAGKAMFQNNEQANATTKAFRDLAKSSSEMAASIKGVAEGTKSVNDLSKTAVKYSERKKQLEVEFGQALGNAANKAKLMEKFSAGTFDMWEDLGKAGEKMTGEQLELLEIYQEQMKAISDQDKEFNKLSKRAKNINKGFGLVGSTFEGIGSILEKAGFGDLANRMNIPKAVDEGKKLSATLTKGGTEAATLGTKFKVAAKMVGTIGSSLIASLGPVAILAKGLQFLVEAFKEVDKAAGDLAKSQGISYDQALKIGQEYRNQAHELKLQGVHGHDIAEASKTLNERFGTSVKFSKEITGEMAQIQKRTGLSADSMGYFAKTSMASGKSVKATFKDIQKTVFQQNKQRKLHLNVKKIQEGIAKSSNLIKLHAKGNMEQLTKAVMASKDLGLSLEGVENTASGLLDFEQSIAAEMEAELLTGKELNLERARQAALEGDMATVADEIAKNVGSAADFAEMNVIQQEALARAMNMGRKEMADMLVAQEEQNMLQDLFGDKVHNMNEAQAEYNRLSEEGLLTDEMKDELAEKGLLTQLDSASEAEKMAETMGEIKQYFADIAMKAIQIFKKIKDMVGGGKNLAKIIAGIAASWLVIKGVMMFEKVWRAGELAFQTTRAAIMGTQAVAATTTNAMATFGLGTVVAVAAVATALGALAAYGLMSDGVIGPGGEMVVSGPKGSIQLDKDDSIIAGTNLFGKGGGGGGGNSEAMINTLNEANVLLAAIAAKETTIEMGGNEVGQGINTAERAIQ